MGVMGERDLRGLYERSSRLIGGANRIRGDPMKGAIGSIAGRAIGPSRYLPIVISQTSLVMRPREYTNWRPSRDSCGFSM